MGHQELETAISVADQASESKLTDFWGTVKPADEVRSDIIF
jgi:hypothetical protein